MRAGASGGEHKDTHLQEENYQTDFETKMNADINLPSLQSDSVSIKKGIRFGIAFLSAELKG